MCTHNFTSLHSKPNTVKKAQLMMGKVYDICARTFLSAVVKPLLWEAKKKKHSPRNHAQIVHTGKSGEMKLCMFYLHIMFDDSI